MLRLFPVPYSLCGSRSFSPFQAIRNHVLAWATLQLISDPSNTCSDAMLHHLTCGVPKWHDQTQPRLCCALDPGKEKAKSVNSDRSYFVRPLLGLLITSPHGI